MNYWAVQALARVYYTSDKDNADKYAKAVIEAINLLITSNVAAAQ
jgi:hypothetical protein